MKGISEASGKWGRSTRSRFGETDTERQTLTSKARKEVSKERGEDRKRHCLWQPESTDFKVHAGKFACFMK